MGAKIIRLQASNVKRLTAVDITPDPGASTVIVGGRNAQGKSSCLDAIAMALGGAAHIPGKPVRRGASKARIELDLGDIQVVRTFSAGGSSALEVRGKDGAKLKSPQAVLDRLCSRIAFDPLEYSRMKPGDQADVLRELVGLDTSKLDADRAGVYQRRTEASREVSKLKAQLEQLPQSPEGTPEAEVSVADLLAELQRRQDLAAARAKLEVSWKTRSGDCARAESEVTRIGAMLRQAQEYLETCKRSLEASKAALETAEAVPPTDEVKTQLAGVEATNRAVRAVKERNKIAEDLRRATKVVQNFTNEIDQYDEAKRAVTASVEFPIAGLGFGEDGGVLLNGLPLEQASSAEKLRCSVAMGLALHPELKVLLVRDGSLLDGESLAMVAEIAAAAGGQVWLEVVTTDAHGCSVFIEDGRSVNEDGSPQCIQETDSENSLSSISTGT